MNLTKDGKISFAELFKLNQKWSKRKVKRNENKLPYCLTQCPAPA